MTEWKRGPAIDACNAAVDAFMAGLPLVDAMADLGDAIGAADALPNPDPPRDGGGDIIPPEPEPEP